MNELEDQNAGGSYARFIASIERYTALLLDRLAQTPSGKFVDEKETRMLGSIVMKSYVLWMKAFTFQRRDQALQEKLRKLRKSVPENSEKEV